MKKNKLDDNVEGDASNQLKKIRIECNQPMTEAIIFRIEFDGHTFKLNAYGKAFVDSHFVGRVNASHATQLIFVNRKLYVVFEGRFLIYQLSESKEGHFFIDLVKDYLTNPKDCPPTSDASIQAFCVCPETDVVFLLLCKDIMEPSMSYYVRIIEGDKEADTFITKSISRFDRGLSKCFFVENDILHFPVPGTLDCYEYKVIRE